MNFIETELSGSFVVELNPFQDSRGWFVRSFCKDEFGKIGHAKEWLQLNHSFTSNMGSIRGMHYQLAPFSEIKLVRCIAGAVFDVIVDLRAGSPTFLKWFGVELSAQNRKMIYIPAGFAHGFQALTNNCELLYHHTAFYQPGFEGGIRFDDPLVAIEWPLLPTEISERDQNHSLIDLKFKGIKYEL
jgi:dTDP-4-dehydrorhamnose 3,5-epimerase